MLDCSADVDLRQILILVDIYYLVTFHPTVNFLAAIFPDLLFLHVRSLPAVDEWLCIALLSVFGEVAALEAGKLRPEGGAVERAMEGSASC